MQEKTISAPRKIHEIKCHMTAMQIKSEPAILNLNHAGGKVEKHVTPSLGQNYLYVLMMYPHGIESRRTPPTFSLNILFHVFFLSRYHFCHC